MQQWGCLRFVGKRATCERQIFQLTSAMGLRLTVLLLALALTRGVEAQCTATESCERCTRQSDDGVSCKYCHSARACRWFVTASTECESDWRGSPAGFASCEAPPPPKEATSNQPPSDVSGPRDNFIVISKNDAWGIGMLVLQLGGGILGVWACCIQPGKEREPGEK